MRDINSLAPDHVVEILDLLESDIMILKLNNFSNTLPLTLQFISVDDHLLVLSNNVSPKGQVVVVHGLVFFLILVSPELAQVLEILLGATVVGYVGTNWIGLGTNVVGAFLYTKGFDDIVVAFVDDQFGKSDSDQENQFHSKFYNAKKKKLILEPKIIYWNSVGSTFQEDQKSLLGGRQCRWGLGGQYLVP
jgi:hypothetical protein